MDLTKAEDIKKRWQEYTEELYKKDLNGPDNHSVVITHLEPDILQCCDQPRQHIKKQRHYLANKAPSSQVYGFSSNHVWMWGLDHKESWAPKIDAFELWCWRRLLRVPWTARRSNQFTLKEISPECSLEGLMLRLKLQFFGYLIWRADSVAAWKDSDTGKDWR